MTATVSLSLDLFAPERVLGGQGVVSGAAKPKVGDCVPTTLRVGHDVIELQVVRFTAAHAAVVDEGAPRFIALEDTASHRGRDISAALARGLDFARPLRPEALLLD